MARYFQQVNYCCDWAGYLFRWPEELFIWTDDPLAILLSTDFFINPTRTSVSICYDFTLVLLDEVCNVCGSSLEFAVTEADPVHAFCEF